MENRVDTVKKSRLSTQEINQRLQIVKSASLKPEDLERLTNNMSVGLNFGLLSYGNVGSVSPGVSLLVFMITEGLCNSLATIFLGCELLNVIMAHMNGDERISDHVFYPEHTLFFLVYAFDLALVYAGIALVASNYSPAKDKLSLNNSTQENIVQSYGAAMITGLTFISVGGALRRLLAKQKKKKVESSAEERVTELDDVTSSAEKTLIKSNSI